MDPLVRHLFPDRSPSLISLTKPFAGKTHQRSFAFEAKPVETFKQFNFEAAHQTPPFSSLHGHSFVVTVHLVGEPDPVYGWSHNMYELDAAIAAVRAEVDHKYLNDISGLEVPTLENLTKWMVEKLDGVLQGVDRVQVRRGLEGTAEGCTMRPRRRHNQAA
jgi:6-pyruvoyltetrahydropterin/6-carboxytetrahydropterin synthase